MTKNQSSFSSFKRAFVALFIGALFFSATQVARAQIISYQDFQSSYEPSKFIDGDIVLEAGKLDPSSSGSSMGKKLQSNFSAGKVGYELAGIILPYIPRNKLTDVYKQWSNQEILKVLKNVDPNSILDVVYYLPESTYNEIGSKIKKLKKYKPKKK